MFELEGLVAVSGGCSLAALLRLPIPMASLVAEHRLEGMQASIAVAHGLGSCGSRM